MKEHASKHAARKKLMFIIFLLHLFLETAGTKWELLLSVVPTEQALLYERFFLVNSNELRMKKLIVVLIIIKKEERKTNEKTSRGSYDYYYNHSRYFYLALITRNH